MFLSGISLVKLTFTCSSRIEKIFKLLPNRMRSAVITGAQVIESPILYKMDMVNRVSAFQNYHNFSDVIAEQTKQASEKSEPLKSE